MVWLQRIHVALVAHFKIENSILRLQCFVQKIVQSQRKESERRRERERERYGGIFLQHELPAEQFKLANDTLSELFSM